MKPLLLLFVSILFFAASETGTAQERPTSRSLTQRLLTEPINDLVRDAENFGDPSRGAIAFYQPTMNCAKCHESGSRRLGPSLTEKREAPTQHLIESVLKPSSVIHDGFQTVRVAHNDGRLITGVLVNETDAALIVDSIEQADKQAISKDDIEEWTKSKSSSMPIDLANQLADRQQFLDLISYLGAIVGNPALQTKLKPATATPAPLPEYESRVDHAGLIRGLNGDSLERGGEVYRLRCASCHGTIEAEGSMPTSLRFGKGKFKHGNDPLTMYKTLTHGYGMMNPQRWMVPQQKYEVIHYIREHFLKEHNSGQLFDITDDYLASLPKGDTRGPKPIMSRPWTLMDYGHSMMNTIEVSDDGSNIAQKGIVVRLDTGQGGVESGSHWMMYEHDTMRVAGAWSGSFIDWEGIHFNGTHGRHPSVNGEVHFSNPTGPGFARPGADSDSRFTDDRVIGRDGKHYGPLPRDWAQYLGMYRFGDRSIIKYRVGETEVLESPSLAFIDKRPIYTRHLNIGKRTEDLVIQIANIVGPAKIEGNVAIIAEQQKVEAAATEPKTVAGLQFDGTKFGEVESGDRFNMHDRDFSIYARIKTTSDGTIFSKTKNQNQWMPQGQTLFLSGGRPTFDIGWVGAVEADRRVNDGKWHELLMTWNAKKELVRFYVDGDEAGGGEIAPKRKLKEATVVRIGFTNNNFPADPYFEGEMSEVRFYQLELSPDQIKNAAEIIRDHQTGNSSDLADVYRVGMWNSQTGSQFRDSMGNPLMTANVSGAGKTRDQTNRLAAACSFSSATWTHDDGNLRLKIPAGEAINLAVSHVPIANQQQGTAIKKRLVGFAVPQDLSRFTHGGPANYPEQIETPIIRGDNKGPFAVDVFERPTNNPWNAQLRLTGIDFLPDGDVAIVSAWDGSVWRVTGFLDDERKTLAWQRIAAGLFQPLGVKCVGDKIYVICRDQIVRLHDLNGDHEADWYENFNSDHQVTEHFHEFAMGLQTDDEGNFYYAKSARHAKKAVVPHHGTLLKVSADGKRTEIVANGFRAANGVCINGDGSFVVTDQEGHWNPKNRINWVRPGEFYGNMFGYHDVEDDSDSAMQDPLCWITNSFDRSPGELLWVNSDKWGPLEGSLLNFSYGYGKVYVVPHESVDGKIQGGMCEFPIEQFPTGVMRGRFHPGDGQLYCCGMFAWAGSQHKPGGLYRIRYTKKPVHLPVGLSAKTEGMTIRFSGKLDEATSTNPDNYSISVWDLKRTKNYGSEHYNERPLAIESARLLADGKSVELSIAKLQPTWGMEIKYEIKSVDAKPIVGKIHNSIFRLAK
jgi:putative heme-binding domain-containing protein